MSSLTYVQKEQMANFFGIRGGYVFTFLKNGYNKTNTRNIIFEATGIDIFSNPNYEMSQERCIRKVWDDCDDYTVGKLLKVMLDYYKVVATWSWEPSEILDYQELRDLEKQLMQNQVSMPDVDADTLKLLKEDIERNCNNNTPELALDRLHTFSTKYFRTLCGKHGISTKDAQGNELPLQSLVGGLRKWYEEKHYFRSDFSLVAIRYAINVFDKLNAVRNNQSAAHPNEMLNKAEAMFAIRIVSETLSFIDEIERTKDEEDAFWAQLEQEAIADQDYELPF